MNGVFEFQASHQKGQGYLALPADGARAGVLVLHAWWGLSPIFTGVCDRLAQAGFIALAPDLYSGQIATTREQAEQVMSSLNHEEATALISGAIKALRDHPGVEGKKIGVIGFSLGAFFALTLKEDVNAIVVFYGTSGGENISIQAAFQGHFAEQDEFEPRELVEALEENLRERGLPVSFYTYHGTRHWFFEENQPGYYNAEAAELAWQRTTSFLHNQLG